MKESDRIHAKRKRFNILLWVDIALSIVCMIGFLVILIMMGLNAADIALLSYLCSGFIGGALLFGLFGMLLYRYVDKIAGLELDALEREDNRYSFHIGEGTLATLDEKELRIHGGSESRPIRIPYFDVKFYSVCSRKTPREKGTWNVLVEIPAHYLKKREEHGLKPILIQMDAKERLYARIRELGFELLGEEPKLQGQSNEKFKPMKKFVKPDEGQRGKTIVLMILGFLFIVGGMLVFLLLPDKFSQATTIGAIVVVLGVYFGIRAIVAYVKAKAIFAVYREGVYFRNSGIEAAFLKWEEILDIEMFVRDYGSVLRANCLYGKYDFPVFEGSYEYIAETFPEKVSKS